MEQEIPEIAKSYFAVVEDRQDHPFIKSHFYQVTWFALPNTHPERQLFALEFRIARYSALVWLGLAGKWQSGGWLKLAHVGADVNCPPTPLTIAYFQQAISYKSLDEALATLAQTQPQLSFWETYLTGVRSMFRQ